MRTFRKNTTKLAKVLIRHPAITADIFEQGAAMRTADDIVEQINTFWDMKEKYGVELSIHYVWALFHRKAPFQDPAIYREVCDEHKRIVANRLRTSVKLHDIMSPYGNESLPCEENDAPRIRYHSSHIFANNTKLIDVLSARLHYEEALARLVETGLKPEDIETWLELTLELTDTP